MTDEPPPGLIRDHNEPQQLDNTDAAAIASLIKVAGDTLHTVDSQNVGGNSNIKALQMDGRQLIGNLPIDSPPKPQPTTVPPPVISSQSAPPQPSPVPNPVPQTVQPPPVVENRVEVVAAMEVASELADRVKNLEELVPALNKCTKFKRGISYNVTTAKVKGEYKDPALILELVASSLASGARSITIKFNGTKNTKPR
ncbi:hypothetical protein CL622_02160 [archaeon]|nr:hypothetical protein [archaeon]